MSNQGSRRDADRPGPIESRLTAPQLRVLTDSLPHLVWTCLAEGPCDYLSRQWVEYTGIPESEQLGYGWLQQLHPDDRERVKAEWAATVGTGEPFDIEFRIRRGDGVHRWFKTRAIPLRDARGTVVKWYGSNTDIDDLKRAEELAHASEEQLRITIYSIGDGVITTDDSGRITRMNPVAAALTGWSEADAQGRPVVEVFRIVNEETRLPVESPVARVLLDGLVVGLANHTMLIGKDGTERAVADSGAPIRDAKGRTTGVVLVFRDQSDERASRKALADSEAKYRGLFENAQIGIFRSRTDGSALLDVNQKFLDIFGFSREEMLSSPATLRWARPAERDEMIRRLRETGIVVDHEMSIVTKTGETRDLLLSVKPYPEQGVLEGTGLDITERKARERELDRLRRILEIRNRIADVFLRMSDADMYSGVLDVLLDAFHSRFGVFGFIDEAGAFVVPSMTRHVWDQCQVRDKRYVFPRETWGDSSWPTAIRTGTLLYSNERSALTPAGHVPIDRHISAPVIHRGEVIGLFQVANKQTDYDEDDLALARTIADAIAPILDARLAQDRARKDREEAEARAAEAQRLARIGNWDWDAGRDVIRGSAEFFRLFDVNPEDLATFGQFIDRLRPDDRERVQQDVAAAMKLDRSYDTEYRVRLRDGGWRDIWARGYVVRDEQGAAVRMIGTCQDVTDSKRAEARKTVRMGLHEFAHGHSLEDLLRKALDEAGVLTESPIGFFHLVDSDLATLTLTAWSTRTEAEFCTANAQGDHYGIDRAGVWVDCVHQRKPVIHNDYASLPHRKGMPEGHAVVVRELVVPVLRAGGIVAIMGVGNKPSDYDDRDVETVSFLADVVWGLAETKLAQERLRESEGHLRKLYEESPLGYQSLDERGVVLDVNRRWLEHLGFAREEVVGRSFADFLAADDVPVFRERFPLFLARGSVAGSELAMIRKDGSTLHASFDGRVSHDAEGRFARTHCVMRDVTETRRLEAERKRFEAAVRQQQKLEAIGTLASGVAHEINNPVNAMMNYAQLIQDEVPSDGQIAEFAGRIFAEGERIAGIVRGLLAFARQDKEAHSPSAVGDIVRAGVSLLGNTFVKDHVRLEIEIPDDLPKVRCRSQQIQQVVLNLLTNARDALNERHPGSHEDKVLRVAAVPWEIGGFPAVRLTVEDHGTGIPEAVRERVFEPFFTTKQRGVGTGLGLSISHGIVEEHHGRLTCESEPGKGASFHVDLPVDNGWRLGSDPGDAPPDAGQGG